MNLGLEGILQEKFFFLGTFRLSSSKSSTRFGWGWPGEPPAPLSEDESLKGMLGTL